jgi:hypothetical protein
MNPFERMFWITLMVILAGLTVGMVVLTMFQITAWFLP